MASRSRSSLSLQRRFRSFAFRNIGANADETAIARPVFAAQQPAPVPQMLFVHLVSGFERFQALLDPGVNVGDGFGVLSPFGGGSRDMGQRGSRHQDVVDPGVELPVFRVALDQAHFGVVVNEAVVNAFDGIPDPGFALSATPLPPSFGR